MIYRTLGKTGEKVSAIGLGGYHLGFPPEPATAIQIVRSAVDRGITFLDNCWTTTLAKANAAWGSRCGMDIASGCS